MRRYALVLILAITSLGANIARADLSNVDLAYLGTLAKNYAKNGGAEQSTRGWITYSDAAGTQPVDCTGGSPSVTWTTSTSSPISGGASFLWTHPSSNRQGDGASYAFTTDGTPVQQVSIAFDYAVSSGTFAAGVVPIGGATAVDSDVEVYVYDVTNAAIIQPSNFRLLGSSSSAQRYTGTFQTPSNSTSFRLCLHGATTTASSFVLKVDNVAVRPVVLTSGPPVSGTTAYTPTFTGWGTVSGLTASYYRDAQFLVGHVQVTTGTNTGVAASASLPSGISIDSSVVGANQKVGTWGASATPFSGDIFLQTGTSTTLVYFSNGAAAYTTALNGSAWANATTLSFDFRVPILGWASNVALSSTDDGRMIGFEANTATATITGSASDISWTKVRDDIGSFNGTTTWTATTPGWYFIDAAIRVDGTFSAGNDADISINVAGTNKYFGLERAGGAQASLWPHISKATYLNAGDAVKIQISSAGSSLSSASNTTYSWWTITKWPAAAQLGPSDTVAAKYYASGNTTSTTAAPINYDTKVYDLSGAVTTGASWKFTAPIAGKYLVSTFNNTASGTNNTFLALYKNGSKYEDICFSTAVNTNLLFGATQVPLLAGDFIDLRCTTSTAISGNATQSSDLASHVEITRVGN